jgi:pyrimidine-nucleoside phosphorylase
MQASELIRKKRDGEELRTAEIDWLIEHYTQGNIPDYQMSAWLMAVYWQGMTTREIGDLTLAMAHSGEELHVREMISPVIDKHSTGGVGDKVTLVVAPLVAACGVAVGKMTGRGLGHTGGTIDKLEAIPGFRSELSRADFMRILLKHNIVLAGQSADLAPADGKIYALRDVTGTIESIPLIAASIMSKKLAIGSSHLLLDVKFGLGAFMKTPDRARELAATMVEIGRSAQIQTVAAITSMQQPLGHAVGNALELVEAIAILRGEGPQDIADLCYHEAAELLVMTGKAAEISAATQIVEHAVHSGAGIAKLSEVVAAQGGDPRCIEQPHLLPSAPTQSILPAPCSGYITGIHAEQIGFISMRLGGGRFKKGEQIDTRTGLVLQAKIGDYLHAGDPLVVVHARNNADVDIIKDDLLHCYTWNDTFTSPDPLIYDIIHP